MILRQEGAPASPQPRVAYVMGSRFGTSDSLGTVSGYAVQGLLKAGYLHQLLVGSYHAHSVPSGCTRQLGFISRVLRKLAVYDASGYLNVMSDNVFDWWSSRQVSGCNLLHAWGQGALYNIRRAKALGAVTIVERASSHVLAQRDLLVEEYAHHGIKHPPIPQPAIDKSLKESEEADYTLVPSRFAYDSFIERGFPARKLILNPFGVDTERFQPGSQQPNRFRAVFAGQISLRKGVLYLLEAWTRLKLPEAELVIIGTTAPDTHALVIPYLHHTSIRWVGYVPNLQDYLREASVFVFPSIEEGSALVTYLALACGLPVVTTPNAGSVVRHGQDGFIVPIQAVEALCEALEYLYTHSDQQVQMGRSARKRAEEYPWSRYQLQLIAHYQRLASG